MPRESHPLGQCTRNQHDRSKPWFWLIRLPFRNDWTSRYPLVVEAVNHLKVRSCVIDGEVVCCDEKGVTSFQLLRHRRNEPQAFLYAFDLLELNGDDLRREPIEVRKATLASILRKRADQVCA